MWAFGLGGPLHSDAASDKSVPISNAVSRQRELPVFWGDPELQGLHVGIFIALAALVVFWVLLEPLASRATRRAPSASTPTPRSTAASTRGGPTRR